MADSLKNDWKETGTNLGHAFRDLAKTIVRTGAKGIKKAESWANDDGKQSAETADKAENTNETAKPEETAESIETKKNEE